MPRFSLKVLGLIRPYWMDSHTYNEKVDTYNDYFQQNLTTSLTIIKFLKNVLFSWQPKDMVMMDIQIMF